MVNAELFAAYFKTGTEYYLNKLERYETGNRYSFNVYAFFLGIFWFMYRKMYKEAAIITVVIVAEGYLEDLLTVDMSGTHVKVISRLTTLLINIFISMFANVLYIKKAESVIAEVQQAHPNHEDLINHLNKKGGVSYLFLIALFIAIVGIVWYFYAVNNQR